MTDHDYGLYAARFQYDTGRALDERQKAMLDRFDIFPLEGELRQRALKRPIVPEPPRADENGKDCSVCDATDEEWLYRDDNWSIRTWAAPRAFPSVLLYPRTHCDLPDMPEDVAAGLGAALRQTAQAIGMLEGIARVHVEKRGDAEEHMHWYLLGRAEGLMQCRGSFLPLWDMLLPPMPKELWLATAEQVRINLESIGGPSGGYGASPGTTHGAVPC